LLAERISALPYPKFVREQIFEPLGMKNSTIYQSGFKIEERGFGYARNEQRDIIPSDQSLTSATKGDGGVYTSLNDYSRWIQALRNNRLVNFEKIAEKLNHPIPEQINSFYGAGWFMQGKSPATFFHSGSTCGFTNFVIEIPSESFSVIYFSNIANNERPFEAILEVLARHGFPDLKKVLSLHTLTR
jgi:CubicO group peptidase (beta-lactamase class C family)